MTYMPGGGSGSHSIATSSDVALNNAATNEVLTYDASVSKWKNAVAPAATDATTTAKGVVQLAGDLGGTAAAPTVPGLAFKADSAHTHAADDITSGTIAASRLGAGTANAAAYLRGDNSWADFSAGVRGIMPSIRTVTAAVTLELSDDVVRVDSASALVVTVPANASVAFPVGSIVQIRRNGAGAVSIAGEAGVTIHGALSGVPQYASYSLMKVAADIWDIEGGIS